MTRLKAAVAQLYSNIATLHASTFTVAVHASLTLNLLAHIPKALFQPDPFTTRK